jgi:hypothetical protein
VGAQVFKNRSTDDVERFLSLIRFEQRGKLEELKLDLYKWQFGIRINLGVAN